ncbi:AbrB/MazE/SpoVT family DNA-binding domain-containing protein [Caldilinea sp.]|uniref:AbrB/MazE/SpoVT family DNA-binding domain-containing protein n=1 Tax=Caldilinea sp. TaxID=2293560 RepID=UPI0021DCFF90|nr:AbrB/MazE/SpoVT family DNA-binding domain-containing protein [Caldilinea sp.]GIV71060.1 MAG: hypothetical protein KatS3mg048_3922 [Caldilinea sp.]
METVTVSPKYQVVLPKAARNALGLKVGQKMIVFAYDQRIVLVPDRPASLGSIARGGWRWGRGKGWHDTMTSNHTKRTESCLTCCLSASI